jgi:basic amino acid/polyamine antiporter, APA family
MVERLLRRKTLRMVAREARLEVETSSPATLLDAGAVVIPADTEPVLLEADSAEDSGAIEVKEHTLRRELSLLDIIAYGVGCTVGAGIYSLVGEGAQVAGPAVLLSFVVGAVSCVLTGLAYSELAALVPLSGSAYTYALVTLGELPAWLVGWNLTLEYAISSAAIARSWASYVGFLFSAAGAPLPDWVDAWDLTGAWVLSPLAALLVLACTFLLTRGVSVSSKFNIVVTAVNILVLTFVVIYGSSFVDPANWTAVNDSFVPYGMSSVMTGAGVVFFSFLGFDMVSSLAEEVKNPQRTMPLGIISSLGASAAVYVAVCLVVTGMAPFTSFTDTSEHRNAPLSFVFQFHGAGWAAIVVAIGSIAGLTSAAFTCIMGQPRIFFRMAKDGLLWGLFADVSPTTGIPTLGTWITGAVTALVALFVPLEILAQAISIGTLLAFCSVCAGIILLHLESPWADPSRPRAGISPPGPSLLATWCSSCTHCGKSRAGEVVEGGAGAMGTAEALSAPPRSRLVTSLIIALFLLGLGAGFSSSNSAPVWVSALLYSLAGLVFVAMLLMPRRTIPNAPFLCPAVPAVPALGMFVNCIMMASLPLDSWWRMLAWALVGVIIYIAYGFRNSILRHDGFSAVDGPDAKMSLTRDNGGSNASDMRARLDSE